MKSPAPFLHLRVHRLDLTPSLTALCAGYELNEWRCRQLATHLLEWLPEFALTHSELQDFGPHNAIRLLRQAARSVYTSEKYQKRGELGELLLHAAIRQTFTTVPAISKYFFKDSENDTVKGFDAVHVIATEKSLELWLGEVKFYNGVSKAIYDVVEELNKHCERDYLRSEFTAITNKIDSSWPHSGRLKGLLDPNTSLDVVFDSVCIPVLLTYDSPAVDAHKKATSEFSKAFEEEVIHNHGLFKAKGLPENVVVRLFLVPLKEKAELVKIFDEELKSLQ